MALCPFASKRLVAAHGGPMGAVIGVVEHVTAGEGDPYNEFSNIANKASSHFGIGNGQGGMADGLIEQYVDTSQQSWAQAAGNSSYISVETEGEPTEPLTAAQVAAFGRLYAWLHQVHGVPFAIVDLPGNRGLIWHGAGGAAWGSHFGCPGDLRKAQRQAILTAAAGSTGTAPSPVPPVTSTLPGVLFFMPTDNEFIVRYLYLEFLLREPDAGGFATDVAYLNAGGTYNQLLSNLQDSPEGKVVLNGRRVAAGLPKIP